MRYCTTCKAWITNLRPCVMNGHIINWARKKPRPLKVKKQPVPLEALPDLRLFMHHYIRRV